MIQKIPARLLQALLLISSISYICGSELPNDAIELVKKRDKAVKAIDERLVDELDKLKLNYTRKGDLDSANAIVALIEQYSSMDDVAKTEAAQIARLVGTWKRDYDGGLFVFKADGTGVFNGRDGFRVTYDPNKDQFEMKSPRWRVANPIEFEDGSDSKVLLGKHHQGSYKLTKIK
jgi:hypothetical protein